MGQETTFTIFAVDKTISLSPTEGANYSFECDFEIFDKMGLHLVDMKQTMVHNKNDSKKQKKNLKFFKKDHNKITNQKKNLPLQKVFNKYIIDVFISLTLHNSIFFF